MSETGWKTITSMLVGMLYISGLLFKWWEPNMAVESFIVLFFGVGATHKAVKYRKAKKQYEEVLNKSTDLDDLVRRHQK